MPYNCCLRSRFLNRDSPGPPCLCSPSRLTHYLATLDRTPSNFDHPAWVNRHSDTLRPSSTELRTRAPPPVVPLPFTFLASLLIAASTALTLVGYTLPAHQSWAYLSLRWKAWTEPSRSGIPADLVRHASTRHNWETLDTKASGTRHHPVEASTAGTPPHSGVFDP